MRQQHGAAYLLVAVARVDAEPHVQLDGLVKFGGRQLAHQTDGLFERVILLAIVALQRCVASFSILCHFVLPVVLTGAASHSILTISQR